MKTKFKFTKTALEAVQKVAQRTVLHDTETPGLILICHPTGTKTFYLQKKLAGRAERIMLGNFPQTTIEQAKGKAAEIYSTIAIHGANPAEIKRTAKEEPKFSAVFERFLKEKRNRSGQPLSARNVEEYRKVVTTHMARITGEKLSSITRERCRTLVNRVKSPSQANKVKAILSAVFNWSKDMGIHDLDNPASRIKTKVIASRERFLLPSEFPRFMAAVEQSPLRDFFLLALYTGARRSNLQAMRWREINLDERTWTIPKTKNGQPQTIALSPEAVEIISNRMAQAIVSAEYVFPGAGHTGHLSEPKAAWRNVLAAAGVDNLRLHDLRRTLGSWQARQGASLSVIGKSLGHKSQQATAIYSRLDLDPVRASVEGAVSAMVEASKQTAQVIPLRRTAKP